MHRQCNNTASLERQVKRAGDKNALSNIAQDMSNGMTNVRSTDTNTHKQTAVLAILLADTIGDKLDPPLPEDRGLLGYINMRTAELLCPVDCLADIRSNPESVAKALQSGQSKKYLSKGDKLLWSLYDETLCVLGKMFEGAFRSRFVIRLGRSVLLGAVALQSDTEFGKLDGRENNTESMGMDVPTSKFIGYICTVGRFLLSDQISWARGGKDGTFDYMRFHRMVVKLIDDLEGTVWHDELIGFWSKNMSDPSKVLKRRDDSEEPLVDASLQTEVEEIKRASLFPSQSPPRAVSPSVSSTATPPLHTTPPSSLDIAHLEAGSETTPVAAETNPINKDVPPMISAIETNNVLSASVCARVFACRSEAHTVTDRSSHTVYTLEDPRSTRTIEAMPSAPDRERQSRG